MNDQWRQSDAGRGDDVATDPRPSPDGVSEADPIGPASAENDPAPPPPKDDLSPEPHFEEGVVDDLSNLIDDGISYAQAEIAFQKTRAALAGKSAGFAALYVVVALFLLHIALLALAVGLVIALEPLVTIWGAIAIVVGGLLLLTAWLGLKARGRAQRISALFSGNSNGDGA